MHLSLTLSSSKTKPHWRPGKNAESQKYLLAYQVGEMGDLEELL